ncbi:hypothetical protein P4479_25475 [Brevibacillus agri]|uniref:hypothetical protein n=1 Tax=Brevibacillus agri TaxID=51101 RepID=UPI002E1B60B7|nr:hypothetical protein [Brevibacillus agri]
MEENFTITDGHLGNFVAQTRKFLVYLSKIFFSLSLFSAVNRSIFLVSGTFSARLLLSNGAGDKMPVRQKEWFSRPLLDDDRLSLLRHAGDARQSSCCWQRTGHPSIAQKNPFPNQSVEKGFCACFSFFNWTFSPSLVVSLSLMISSR